MQAHAATGGEAQEWARAMLGNVGRGGNAQARRARLLDAAAEQRALESVVCMRMHGQPAAPVQLAPHRRIACGPACVLHAACVACACLPGEARPRIAATRTAGNMSDVRPLACAQAQGALVHSCCVCCTGSSALLVVRPSALTRTHHTHAGLAAPTGAASGGRAGGPGPRRARGAP